eukprot:9464210-Pyramimonas_sp.AAC.1
MGRFRTSGTSLSGPQFLTRPRAHAPAALALAAFSALDRPRSERKPRTPPWKAHRPDAPPEKLSLIHI